MSDAIRVESMTKKYPGFTLDHISFTLPAGQVMGFIGENGAGKTTTIQSILGITGINQGRVFLLGRQMNQDAVDIKQDIGVVLDKPGMHESLNIKNMASVLRHAYRNWDEGLFQKYVKDFSLPIDKPFKEYSTGMLQKASIALAMCHHPKLLILDEPTSGLDPVVREEILDIFLDFMQEEDHSILFSSHITTDLDKIADSLTFIHQGKLVFSASREEIQDRMGVCQAPVSCLERFSRESILRVRKNQFGAQALVKDRRVWNERYPDYPAQPGSTEEIMLFYIKGETI